MVEKFALHRPDHALLGCDRGINEHAPLRRRSAPLAATSSPCTSAGNRTVNRHAEGKSTTPGDSYITQSQVFIHELTHAWQIARFDFTPGLVCRVVTGGSSYTPGPSDGDWSGDFGLERQAAVVDRWFGRMHSAGPARRI